MNKTAPAINIWSGSKQMKGLGAALTNPTELSFKKGNIKNHYPISFRGVQFVDAEAAYQQFKTGNLEEDKKLMTQIIAIKFIEYPRLFEKIRDNGGVAWLEKCAHLVVRNQCWEGVGRKSNFICCLIDAYLKIETIYKHCQNHKLLAED